MGRTLVGSGDNSASDSNPTRTEEKLANNGTTELLRIRSRFYGQFSVDSGPGRHFSIDTGFAQDIFTKLWLNLARPWHVADLLGFSHIEEEKGEEYIRIVFLPWFPRCSFFSNQLDFQFPCFAALVDIPIYSAHSDGVPSFIPL